MVTLVLEAPCQPEAQVAVRHAGLAFAARTNAAGRLSVEVPAMQADAGFSLALPGQPVLQARLAVPTLTDFDRVAVTWAGPAAIELHAYEYGADFAAEGHVWRGHPRGPAEAALGQGFTVTLGAADLDAPLRSEIYTFPAGHARRDGSVALTLEAPVTAASCGTDIAATTLTSLRGAVAEPVDLRMAMPACDGQGDVLVLNNLFDTLKIAAR
jgi:hypothetical protein